MAEPIQILHTDDEPDFADMAATFLEREDDRFEVVTATSTSEGLEHLADDDIAIDCVVSDYDMPGQNGIEFLEAVRETYPDVPFILYTGKGSEEVAGDAISAGVSDYLQKESGTDQYAVLANRITNLVSQSRAETELEHEAERRRVSEQYYQQLLEITSDPELSAERKTRQLLELGCDGLDVENGHVVKIDQESARHEVIYVSGSDIVREGITDLSDTYCRRTIRSDEILDVYNAPEEGWEGDPAYERFELGCYIGKKLLVGDSLYGTVCFVNDEPRDEPFTHRETMFFDLLSQWLNQLIERRRRRGQAEAVFAHAQDAIFLVTVSDEQEFRIQQVNQAYEELTGLSIDDVRGKTPRDVISDGTRVDIESRCRECVQRREPLAYEEVLSIGGETIYWRTKLAPVVEDDEVVQLVGTTRDITKQKKYEE